MIDAWESVPPIPSHPIPSPSGVLSTRDLLQLGGELARTSRAIQETGLGLSTGLRLAESRAEAALEKQALLQAQLEEQLQDKMLQEKSLAQLQMQSNLDKADLSARWVPGRHQSGGLPCRVCTWSCGKEGCCSVGLSLPLHELSQSSQATHLADGETEAQSAIAQHTS